MDQMAGALYCNNPRMISNQQLSNRVVDSEHYVASVCTESNDVFHRNAFFFQVFK